MKYKYPETIQIGGHAIKIILIDGNSVTCSAQHYADLYLPKSEIRVTTKCPDGKDRALDYINECLLHELVEAINEIYVVNLGEGSEKENKIDSLAQGLLQIFNQLGIQLIKEG